MSTEVRSLNSYIQQEEATRLRLLDEIKKWDEKITARVQDKEKRSGEMQQNIVMVTLISLQFSKSRVPVTDEIKLRYEQKIKRFFDVIEEQRKIIDRYNLDIPILEKNKSEAQADLVEVETKIKRMKELQEGISTPIDVSTLLKEQTVFKR